MRAGCHLGVLEQDQGRLEVALAESARVGGEFVGSAALDPVVAVRSLCKCPVIGMLGDSRRRPF